MSNLKPMLAGKATDEQLRELFKKFGFIQTKSTEEDTVWKLIINDYENKNTPLDKHFAVLANSYFIATDIFILF